MAVVVHVYVVGHDRVYEYTGLAIVSLYTDQLNVVDEDDRDAPEEGLVIVKVWGIFTSKMRVAQVIGAHVLDSMSTLKVYFPLTKSFLSKLSDWFIESQL